MVTGVIIGMAVATVASGITQGILNSQGKSVEAGYVDVATKSLMACTVLTSFAKFISALKTLG